MGQVIDLRTARPLPPQPLQPGLRCPTCGAELWRITYAGEVRCADCDSPTPYRLHFKDES